MTTNDKYMFVQEQIYSLLPTIWCTMNHYHIEYGDDMYGILVKNGEILESLLSSKLDAYLADSDRNMVDDSKLYHFFVLEELARLYTSDLYLLYITEGSQPRTYILKDLKKYINVDLFSKHNIKTILDDKKFDFTNFINQNCPDEFSMIDCTPKVNAEYVDALFLNNLGREEFKRYGEKMLNIVMRDEDFYCGIWISLHKCCKRNLWRRYPPLMTLPDYIYSTRLEMRLPNKNRVYETYHMEGEFGDIGSLYITKLGLYPNFSICLKEESRCLGFLIGTVTSNISNKLKRCKTYERYGWDYNNEVLFYISYIVVDEQYRSRTLSIHIIKQAIDIITELFPNRNIRISLTPDSEVLNYWERVWKMNRIEHTNIFTCLFLYNERKFV